MKNLITKFAFLAIFAISFSSCDKSPLEEIEVSGTGATTIEIAKDQGISTTGTAPTSIVTLNYIVGEKLFPNKVIPKITVYYLKNTQTSPTKISSTVRTLLYTASNVSLVATSTPAAGAPVVTAIGAYGNASNIVWGLKYSFDLSAIGTGLLAISNGAVINTKETSIIVVVQDAANITLAEYTFAFGDFKLKTS